MNVWVKFSIIGVTSICETYVIKYEVFLSLEEVLTIHCQSGNRIKALQIGIVVNG